MKGFASVYLLGGIGILCLLLLLSGKWIISLKQDAAVQRVEIKSLQESVNAAAKVADYMQAAAALKSAELVRNQREKAAIRNRLNAATRGLAQLENSDEAKSWLDADIPAAVFDCLQSGNCAGVGSQSP